MSASASSRRSWDVLLSLATSYGIQVLQVATGLVLARALGAPGRGLLAQAVLWPTLILVLGNLGVTEAVTFFVAGRPDQKEVYVRSAAYSVVRLNLLMLPIAATCVLLFTDPGARSAGLIYLPYLPLTLMTLIAVNAMLALGRLRDYNTTRLLVQTLITGGICLLFAIGQLNPISAVLTYVAAEMVTALASWLRVGVAPRGRHDLGREILRYGVRAQGSSVGAFLNERGDQLLISLLLAPSKLGIYVVAVSLSAPIALVGNTLAALTFGQLSRHGSWRQLRSRVLQAAGIASLFALGVSLAVPHIAPVIVGKSFAEAYTLVPLLCVAAVLLSITRVLGSALKALGLPGRSGAAESGAVILAAVSLLCLLPRMGLRAAALASVIGYGSSLAFSIQLLRRAYARGQTFGTADSRTVSI